MNFNKLCIAVSILFVSLILNCTSMSKSKTDLATKNSVPQVEKISVEVPSAQKEQFSLRVKKSERKMYLYNGKKLSKTYEISLGFNPTGTKLKQGDGATPEGEYYLTHKNPQSKFYLSLGVSFPNISDAESGLERKIITAVEKNQIVTANNNKQKPPQNTKLGGDIFLHGGGTSSDWTWGCVALSNEDIKELFDLLPLKTPIFIEK